MLRASSITRLSKGFDTTQSAVRCTSLTQSQLIKHLSSTPTLAAQNAFAGPQGSVDPEISLRANKEVFFFRLVCTNVIGSDHECSQDARNVRLRKSMFSTCKKKQRHATSKSKSSLITDIRPVLVTSQDAAGQEANHPGSQCLHLEDISEFRDTGRRVPAVRQ